ncbi:MAG TPA: hypothetical protein VKB13_03870 [Gaiellaceae bacterium]|nr:hypothetical protein [Gaiellaceae bacterium]
MGLANRRNGAEDPSLNERTVKRTWTAVLLGFAGFLLLVWVGLGVAMFLFLKWIEGSPTIS